MARGCNEAWLLMVARRRRLERGCGCAGLITKKEEERNRGAKGGVERARRWFIGVREQ